MTDTRNWDLEALYDVFNRRIESLREQLSSKWDHWRSWWTKWLLDAWNSFFQSSLTSLDLGLLVSERISGILSTLPTAVSDSLASFRSMKNELMTHISKLYSLGDSIKSVWDTIQNSVRLIKTWIKGASNMFLE